MDLCIYHFKFNPWIDKLKVLALIVADLEIIVCRALSNEMGQPFSFWS
jgi:hypothetical protein